MTAPTLGHVRRRFTRLVPNALGEQLLDDYEAGKLTMVQIAEKYALSSEAALRHLLRELGAEMRPGGRPAKVGVYDLMRRYSDAGSCTATAAATGMTPGAVYMRLWRAGCKGVRL